MNTTTKTKEELVKILNLQAKRLVEDLDKEKVLFRAQKRVRKANTPETLERIFMDTAQNINDLNEINREMEKSGNNYSGDIMRYVVTAVTFYIENDNPQYFTTKGNARARLIGMTRNNVMYEMSVDYLKACKKLYTTLDIPGTEVYHNDEVQTRIFKMFKVGYSDREVLTYIFKDMVARRKAIEIYINNAINKGMHHNVIEIESFKTMDNNFSDRRNQGRTLAA